MNMKKSLESLTLELSEINEKQTRIINSLVKLLLQYMSQDDLTRLLAEEENKNVKSI